MQLETGQLVISRRGRDVGRVYMFLSAAGDERVLLVNGKKRTLAQPKQKNIRHINPTGTVLPAEQRKTDHEIQKAVAAYEAATSPR